MKRYSVEQWQVAPEQIPFIWSGKRYLLARLGFQVVVLAAFAVTVYNGRPLVHPLTSVGAGMMLAGFIVRRWAMRQLGERFRGFEVRREDSGLETRGPYAIIRHPGYLGLALMDLGLPLLLGVPMALAAAVIPIAIIIERITLEEQLLARTYREYAAYCATRKRLMPGIW